VQVAFQVIVVNANSAGLNPVVLTIVFAIRLTSRIII